MIDGQIVATLNEEGVLSAKGKPFTASMIKWLRYRYAIPAPSLKNSDALTVDEVAKRFTVNPGVVYYWIERGHLPARRLGPGAAYWIRLDTEKEVELRAWVANSNPIKPQQARNPAESGAL